MESELNQNFSTCKVNQEQQLTVPSNWVQPYSFFQTYKSISLFKYLNSKLTIKLISLTSSLICLIIFTLRVILTIKDLIKIVLIAGENILDEKGNRVMASLFKSTTNLIIIYTGFKFNYETIYPEIDSVWLKIFTNNQKSINQQEAAKLNSKIKSKLIRNQSLIILSTINSIWLIITFLIITNLQIYPPAIIFQLSLKLDHITYFNLYYLLHNLSIICVFISTGLDYIVEQLELISSSRIQLIVDQSTSISSIVNLRRSYESINQLITIVEKLFHLLIVFLLISYLFRSVTIFYDLFFSSFAHKWFFIVDIFLDFLIVQLTIYILSLCNLNHNQIWLSLYRLTLLDQSDSFRLEVSLFMDRVKQLPIGVRLFNYYIINLGVGPGLIAVVVTVVVSISSLNQVFHSKSNLSSTIGKPCEPFFWEKIFLWSTESLIRKYCNQSILIG